MKRTLLEEKQRIIEMMSVNPTEISKLDQDNIDKEILRTAIISELDAINLYEQFAAQTNNEKVKKVFLDIAKEEKTHVGEFEAILLELDSEQKDELKGGSKEVEDIKEEDVADMETSPDVFGDF